MITGCVGLSVIMIGTITLATIALSKNNDSQIISEEKPNGREEYEHVQIGNLINKEDVNACLVNPNTHQFDDDLFKNNIKTIIKKSISKISKFKERIDEYKYEINYQLINNNLIRTDVVWYIPMNYPTKYYDQIEISIKL
ncbi:MAG: hypothetical protein LBL60_02920 [Mycoplasmataceae bacterium]|nr:hypothetical protein [Mycoplasmataceae bacterium]